MSELADFLERVWATLQQGVNAPDATARLPVLATGGPAGPSARMVVLRGVDTQEKTLTFYTHSASGKTAELAATPRAEIVVWDADSSLQIRLTCDVSPSPASDELWRAQGEGARQNYASGAPPGTPIPAPGKDIGPPVQSNMTVLTAHIRDIDALSLARLPHRRARFSGPDFTGTWIAP